MGSILNIYPRECLQLKDANERLQNKLNEQTFNESKYLKILESVAEGYVELDLAGNFTFFNETVCDAFGYSKDELLSMNNTDYTSEETAKQMYHDFSMVYDTGRPIKQREYEIITKQGSKKTVEISAHLMKNSSGEPIGFHGVARDVSERKKSEKALQEREKKYRLLADNIGDVVWTALIQNDGSLLCNYISPSVRHVLGYSPEEVINGYIDLNKAFTKESSEKIYNITKQILEAEHKGIIDDSPKRVEAQHYTKKGFVIWVEIIITLLRDENKKLIGVQGVTRDINERKQMEQKLREISQFDSLTGVYNRAVFEEEMDRIQRENKYSVGTFVCDLNGLKWVNDTLGHHIGDNLIRDAANILKSCFRKNDIVARIGGDEFGIIIPDTDEEDIECIRTRLNEAVNQHNLCNPATPLSMSIGCAVNSAKPVRKVFKDADNNMYQEKLYNSQSTRSSVIKSLTSTLENRDYITEEHANRMEEIVKGIGKYFDLSEHKINNLSILAKFHDLGKLGVPDRVLFKPGPLTSEEYQIVQRHSEIGHQIAKSGPKLHKVADLILKHHERWDGKGYPLGMQAEEIPLECRLIAILDAFDAMTNFRSYRKPMSLGEALEEIERCAGTQFDPDLAKKFVKFMSEYYVED